MPQTTRENPAGSRGSIFTRLIPKRFRRDSPLVTVIQLNGHIGSVTPLRPGLTLSSCAAAIERAFATGGVKAVALTINSPGGSAVQSTLIHNRIRQLADEKTLPVYAFAEDVAASDWARAYSREQAAYPVESLRATKYWPPVARIDNPYGDRNLVCTCPPIEDYAG